MPKTPGTPDPLAGAAARAPPEARLSEPANTAPHRGSTPWWLLVPLGILGVLAACVFAVVLAISVPRECGDIERRIAAWDDDPAVLFQAQARLKLVLFTHPKSARAWALASRLARVAGEPAEGQAWNAKAIEYAHQGARRAIAAEPRSYEGHVAEGWAYAIAGDPLLAADECRKAQALAPAAPRVLELAARIARDDRRPDDALRAGTALARSPDADSLARAAGWAELARLHAGMAAPEQADSCWRGALAQAPRSPALRRAYARWLGSVNRHDAAIAQAETLVAVSPSARSRAGRGHAHAEKGVWLVDVAHDPARALEQFELASADEPDDPAIWFNIAVARLGLWHERHDDADRAAGLAALARAERLAPRDTDIEPLRAMFDESAGTTAR